MFDQDAQGKGQTGDKPNVAHVSGARRQVNTIGLFLQRAKEERLQHDMRSNGVVGPGRHQVTSVYLQGRLLAATCRRGACANLEQIERRHRPVWSASGASRLISASCNNAPAQLRSCSSISWIMIRFAYSTNKHSTTFGEGMGLRGRGTKIREERSATVFAGQIIIGRPAALTRPIPTHTNRL